jgi:hypothetical protein
MYQNDESNLMFRYSPEEKLLKQMMISNADESRARRNGWRDSHNDAMAKHGWQPSRNKPGLYLKHGPSGWKAVNPYRQSGVPGPAKL